jgi:hypothetical protein
VKRIQLQPAGFPHRERTRNNPNREIGGKKQWCEREDISRERNFALGPSRSHPHLPGSMRFRLLTSLLLVCVLCGCPSQRKDKKDKTKRDTVPTKDVSGDVAFQSFVGRLRLAVEKRDGAMLSGLMAPDFGYRWDPAPPGEDAFIYWDRTRLWGELARLMSERWVPYDGFMVVPPQLAEDPNYAGFRAGVQMVGGSWRFAYFVPAPPAEPPPPPSPAPTSL